MSFARTNAGVGIASDRIWNTTGHRGAGCARLSYFLVLIDALERPNCRMMCLRSAIKCGSHARLHSTRSASGVFIDRPAPLCRMFRDIQTCARTGSMIDVLLDWHLNQVPRLHDQLHRSLWCLNYLSTRGSAWMRGMPHSASTWPELVDRVPVLERRKPPRRM